MGTQKTWIQIYRQKESAMLKEWWPYGCFYRQWVAVFVSIFRFLRKGECLDFSKYQGENSKELELKFRMKGARENCLLFGMWGVPEYFLGKPEILFCPHSLWTQLPTIRWESVFFSSTMPLFAPPEASLPTGALTTPTQTPFKWCQVFSQLGLNPFLLCIPTALCSCL